MNKLNAELNQQYQGYNQKQLNNAFQEACSNGDLEMVKYLLTSSELTVHADIHGDDGYGFGLACQSGHLPIVKYLLTSSELTVHADIHGDDSCGFRLACGYGHLEVVKYLLTSPELTVHANINANRGFGFKWACGGGYLEIVKYLLTSEELMKHVDIHIDDDGGFKFACSEQRLDVVKYLLSFNGAQLINFQQTDFNLNWAVENKYDDIVLAMMQNLQINDPIEYVECLAKIQRYNIEMYEELKNLSVENIKINQPESELFL